MIVDTSALTAILLHEAEEERFTTLLLATDRVRIAAPTLLEARLVWVGRGAANELDELIDLIAAEIVPFDEHQAKVAFEGFEKFGRGRHPARLNFGDCFSYAAAKAFNEPLLYKGGDFVKTDVMSAETDA